jgi:phosphopantetheinyl transferase
VIYNEVALPALPRSRWLRVWSVQMPDHAPGLRPGLRVQMHGLLIEKAAKHAGINPAAVAVERDKNGRPVMTGLPAGYACSLSYGSAISVIALGCGVRLGVDGESLDADRSWRALAKEYFCTGEIDVLARCAEEEAEREMFYRFWTRKEALAKASGRGVHNLGIRPPLSEAARSTAPQTDWVKGWAGQAGYWLTDLSLPGFAVGTVAWV